MLVDFIAKPAALAPKPRVNLTRYHGVLAPNSQHRVWVTPARRGKGSQKIAADQDEKTPTRAWLARHSEPGGHDVQAVGW